MSYFDGFVIAVPTANKQKFIEHARQLDPIFLELGGLFVDRMAGQGHTRRRHEKDDGRPAHGPVHTRQPTHALRRQTHDLRRLRTGG